LSDGAPAVAQGRRLALAADLTWRARRCAAGAPYDDLPTLAARLAAAGPPVERAHRVRFDPPYPGTSEGVEDVRGGRRLVLACAAVDAGGAPEAAVFTTLIAGRAPLVSVGPDPGTGRRRTTEEAPWRPM
jgi:hypothetical protein